MLRMVKGRNMTPVTKFVLQKFKIDANIEKLIIFICGFLLINHIISCLWYFIAKMEDTDPDSWANRYNLSELSKWEIYLTSLYWTLTTVTTVGYGDIVVKTLSEKIYGLCIMTFGVLLYSYILGALSSIVNLISEKNKEMNDKLCVLANMKVEHDLNDEIYNKVRKVIKFDTNKNQKNKIAFMAELPIKLRVELSQELNDIDLKNLYFFRRQGQEFIAYVSSMLKQVKFTQNEMIYKIGNTMEESN
jgi:hypothetical protein